MTSAWLAVVIEAVVFGSDQVLVGRFNDAVADYTVKALADLPGKSQVWAVGDGIDEELFDVISGFEALGIGLKNN
ncbi:MAG: hypothetical protein A2268_11675 [Candidatus Raymondbacteria bacterium RifOxyA12_full_50_37]|uniref:Glycosyl transferase family 1 domain-containing protein n=1 Tax=Candidatus Raymondbacteria bacterium RIFOXYD12_FULL_49_13 TaxID=1817890 RepID=A0A1F7F3T8_UNCRA|nr:MAG: hypothetical protein A2268_11675 [Candidatus Raymondbacteria bacterium RifOxyA12_full_50_37]OGJ85997.1 MAG: hypothetical protein A2248_00510 [Candidatus Raymondbacteria bacterium RIFOXYA2_FULL_49_16]OGJ93785.1 MAG: hypothetical protein A2350_09725 [Candidatus Raymondbacteria bacterium RifOxyB12_full_50_8]OGJ97121.1 MAG: hypothetical protein A2453_12410 [Candidatus Raymondbacteria bacterium RIFOXYC2_FULL_50_21]OGK01176.1 MAG: hypothetical protein A2519_01485 [Candidatus Raymondbacteria b